MYLDGKRYDYLMVPLLLTDPDGRILYKNELAREMDLMRVGSDLTHRMDAPSKTLFKEMPAKGVFLTILGRLDSCRALAVPVTIDQKRVIAMLFPNVLLGKRQNTENEKILLKLALPLGKMLMQMQESRENFLYEKEKNSFFMQRAALMCKLLDLYLSDPNEENADTFQGVSYFISVISFFYKQVFRHQGVLLSLSQTAKECGYVFYDHRSLTVLLLSLIELLIEHTHTHRIGLDIYSEAMQAVIPLKVALKMPQALPDDSSPDAFIIFELLKRKGIEIEMFLSENGEERSMVCRLLLPSHIAKSSLAVFGTETDAESFVADFMDYLAS